MRLHCASWNVLADEWLRLYGEYGHVAPELLKPMARIPHIVRVMASMGADAVGLQEVEKPLLQALDSLGIWQPFWSPKTDGDPDGCLLLVKNRIDARNFTTIPYNDGSGHVMQSVEINGVTFANTHIKWAKQDDKNHAGVLQTETLLRQLSTSRRAVLFADSNDRPGGWVKALLDSADFTNTCGDEPTALIRHKQPNGSITDERAAIDVLAVRDIQARSIPLRFRPDSIPTEDCPSDHVPVEAFVEI